MGDNPLALFLIGGAANGKSSIIRSRFAVGDEPDALLPPLDQDRWCNPDHEKPAIAAYTPMKGDGEALRRWKSNELGGPSGPRNQAEFDAYPAENRDAMERLVQDALGFENIMDFANKWLEEENPDGEGRNFGSGLTHEISKALARKRLEMCLSTIPPSSFIWDAVGNADTYIPWIEDALQNGYRVEIVFVRCMLSVAQMRAANRRRHIPSALVKSTYYKAMDAAEKIKDFVDSIDAQDKLTFEEIWTDADDDGKERNDARLMGYYEEGLYCS